MTTHKQCPQCKATHTVSSDPVEVSEDIHRVHCYCSNCGAHWVDEYVVKQGDKK